MCRKDYKFAQVVKELCAKDVLFFVNVFLNAEDPFAEKGLRHGIGNVRIRPIITYPCQDEFILGLKEAIDKGEDVLADKSRDMLATYMVLAVFLHGWIFDGRKFMISSWKEDEIDGKEDTSTHFGKLRLFLKYLPYYLLPKGFNMKSHSSSMRLTNPENSGTIVGSAQSPNLASGRREDAVFLDEMPKWDKWQKEGWISASDATRCKIAVGTPKGAANFFYELMKGSEVKNKFHLMWWKHPEKMFTSDAHLEKVKAGKIYDKVGKYVVQIHSDQSGAPSGCYVDQNGKIHSEWYDEACRTRIPSDIAENLDCNYLATGNPIFDTEVCSRKKYEAKAPIAVGELNWKVRPIFNEWKTCVNQDKLEVEFVRNSNGMVSIWEHPEDGWNDGYLVTADTAEGLEQGDYDATRVMRRFPKGNDFRPFMVATFHGHLPMHEYAEELAKLAVYYKRAYIAVERNNTGHGVINELFYFYNKLYHKDVLTKGYPEKGDQIGWETNKHSKPVIIKNMSKYISGDEYTDLDERLWDETLTFVNNDGKMEAQGKSQGQKCFDDILMATAICLFVHGELPAPSRAIRQQKFDGWRSNWNNKETQMSESLTAGFL